MTPDDVRAGLLVAPTTAVWTGSATADADEDTDYVAAVSTSTGSLDADQRGFVLRHDDTGEYIRIRSVDSGAGTITLAENGVEITNGDTLAIYPIRLPWPRYQWLDDDGTTYKDYDTAFPADYREVLPAAISVDPAIIVADVGETITLDASDSQMVANATAPNNTVTLAWDAGTDGTASASGTSGAVVNYTADVSWSSAGFRYLKITATDYYGAVTYRYVPAFIGQTANDVLDCAIRWQTQTGAEARVGLKEEVTHLDFSPACLINLDDDEVLFYGYIERGELNTTFELADYSIVIREALSFSDYLHNYPMIIIYIASGGTPDDWTEIEELTFPRAVWFLLHWHSMIPEVCNVDLGDVTDRSIKGQEFGGGSVSSLLQQAAESARWTVRAYVDGSGMRITTDPLYLTESNFNALTGVDLSATGDLLSGIQQAYATPQYNEVRLGGVFRDTDGSFQPLIVKAPASPGPWGSPFQQEGLAPISEAEMRRWAQRLYAISNNADAYTALPRIEIDPATFTVADLPSTVGSPRIAIESFEQTFSPGYADQSLTGRAYGTDASFADVPIPPEPVIPELPDPDPIPPLPPFPPPEENEDEWPTTIYVGTTAGGVYFTDSFTGTDDTTQPKWTKIDDGLPSDNIDYIKYDAENDLVFATVDDELYKLVHGESTWSSVLDATIAEAAINTSLSSINDISMFDIDTGGNIYLWAAFIKSGQQWGTLLTSEDSGATWTDPNPAPPNNIFPAASGLSVTAGQSGESWVSMDGTSSNFSYYSPDIWANSYSTSALTVTKGVKLRVSEYSQSDKAIANSGSGGESGLTRMILLDYDVATGITATVLNTDAIVSTRYSDGHWFSPDDWNHQRSLRGNILYVTLDGWNSYTTGSTISPPVESVVLASEQDTDKIIYGATGPTDVLPHHIFVADGEDDVTPQGRSGQDPAGGALFSIPYTAGGICQRGIQVVG